MLKPFYTNVIIKSVMGSVNIQNKFVSSAVQFQETIFLSILFIFTTKFSLLSFSVLILLFSPYFINWKMCLFLCYFLCFKYFN